MSIVTIEEFGGNSLDRAARILAGIPDGIQKAVNSAMPRTVTHLQSRTADRVRERYAISKANIRANENVKVSYSLGEGLIAYITFSGRKIPLYRYEGNKLSEKSVSAHQLSSTSPVFFEHAFFRTFKSGHTGIFENTGTKTANNKPRLAEIMGSSVPQMLGSEEVEEKLAKDASEKFEERMEHEITRLLAGIGGR